jgi:hypothetical protein
MNVLKPATLVLSLVWSLAPYAQTVLSAPTPNPVTPYSAESITETAQTLADGNHIREIRHGKFYRDSRGRTRTEQSVNWGNNHEVIMVDIHDPVAHLSISYQVNPNMPKQATVFKQKPPDPELVRKAAIAAQFAPKQQSNANDEGCRLTPGLESLGEKTIDGFVVTGTKFTHTINAGEVGNEKPIVMTEQHWHSEELGQDLITERYDPRTGQHTDKLVNIQVGEPDPALFQVPADYTVREQTTNMD